MYRSELAPIYRSLHGLTTKLHHFKARVEFLRLAF